MKSIHSSFSKLSLFFISLFGSALLANDGEIVGNVIDVNDAPLPGVVIAIESANLQGTRQAVSDGNGSFRFVFLPPGDYSVTSSMAGFKTLKSNVKVKLGSTSQLNLKMEVEGTSEEMIVTADLPAIDPTSTTAGAVITDDFFTKIPTGRSVESVFSLAPGVGEEDEAGYTVNGSSGTENQYIFNGVNVTGIELGNQSSNLNFDFIEEVQVKTGGYEAEFGRATGGIINVLTKSGSNEFSGSVFSYFRDRDYSSSARNVGSSGVTALANEESDFGFTLGGPIIKDKFWFFVGYNPNSSTEYDTTPNLTIPGYDQSFSDLRGENETATEERDIDKWNFKLTYQLNENNSFTLSGSGEPQEFIERDATGTVDSDTLTDFDNKNYILKWQSILNPTWTLESYYAYTNQTRDDKTFNGNNRSRVFIDAAEGVLDYGGAGFLEDQDAERTDISVKLGAYFLNHSIKMGVQYEDTVFADSRDYTGLGNTRIYGYGTDSPYIRIRTFAEGSGENIRRKQPQFAETENEYLSAFIQDEWNITNNFTLNLGVRWEEQTLLNSGGGTYHTFDDNLAPRIGLTWDFMNDGTSKLYAHYGRYFQSLPMDINNRAAAPEVLWFRRYYIPENQGTDFLNWTEADIENIVANGEHLYDSAFGSGSTSIDPNAKATNFDEIIVGAEWEMAQDLVIGFRYVNRTLNEVIEDISFDAGDNYIIGNPGEAITAPNLDPNDPLEFYDFQGNFVSIAPGESVTLTPEQVGYPKPERDYKGYEFTASKRFSNRTQFQFSYVHSSTRGNYTGGTLGTQVDPGITALFDIPSTTVNGVGLLPQHRRHRFKFDGSYTTDFGLNFGTSFRYLSGTGVNALGEPDVGNGAYSQFHLLNRGTAAETPALTSVDIKVDYEWNIASRYKLGFYLDVFNVFDFQEATELNPTFSYDAPDVTESHWEWNQGKDVPGTGDEHADSVAYANRYYAWMEGRFANVQELRDWYDANGLTYEDNFLQPTEYQIGRRARLGIRLAF